MRRIMIDTRCGLRCEGCSFKESHGCKGCIATNGNPFHGECPVAKCCQEKEQVHCGECKGFPCKLLIEYSNDPVHGDNPKGARIEQCRQWGISESEYEVSKSKAKEAKEVKEVKG